MTSHWRERMRASAVVAVGLFVLCPYLPAASQSVEQEERFTVRMEGRADGVGFEARKAAVEDAKYNVLAAVLEKTVVSGKLWPLRSLLRDPSLYIPYADPLRFDTLEMTTRVEIDAQVAGRRLNRDIAAIMLPLFPAPPKVLVVVAEQTDIGVFTVPIPGFAEAQLREGLNRLGLAVSGIDAYASRYTEAELLRAIQGSAESGGIFARAYPNYVILLGTVTAPLERISPQSNLGRCRAAVALRVFRGYDGNMTDAMNRTAVVTGVDPQASREQAVLDACAKVLNDAAVAVVVTALGTPVSEHVLLTVERAGSRQRVAALVQLLESDPDVGRVEELFYSESEARFRLEYQGAMNYLVKLLEPVAIDGRKLVVRKVVARDMVVAFR